MNERREGKINDASKGKTSCWKDSHRYMLSTPYLKCLGLEAFWILKFIIFWSICRLYQLSILYSENPKSKMLNNPKSLESHAGSQKGLDFWNISDFGFGD